MNLKFFKTYQLALTFHRQVSALKMPPYLRDQLLRASSSVALNVAEGSGKNSDRDRKRFYSIALGSLRESQAALDIIGNISPEILGVLDQLGACLYRLCYPKG